MPKVKVAIRLEVKIMIWFLRPSSRSHSGQRSKSCLSNYSKTTEASLMKLHRRREHNEKLCCTQEVGSYAQGQGNNQVRGQVCLKSDSL